MNRISNLCQGVQGEISGSQGSGGRRWEAGGLGSVCLTGLTGLTGWAGLRGRPLLQEEGKGVPRLGVGRPCVMQSHTIALCGGYAWAHRTVFRVFNASRIWPVSRFRLLFAAWESRCPLSCRFDRAEQVPAHRRLRQIEHRCDVFLRLIAEVIQVQISWWRQLVSHQVYDDRQHRLEEVLKRVARPRCSSVSYHNARSDGTLQDIATGWNLPEI